MVDEKHTGAVELSDEELDAVAGGGIACCKAGEVILHCNKCGWTHKYIGVNVSEPDFRLTAWKIHNSETAYSYKKGHGQLCEDATVDDIDIGPIRYLSLRV